MRSSRLIAALLLFAGSPASAQVVSGPVRLAPSVSAPVPVTAPAPGSALAAGTGPVLLAPSLGAPSSPAPLPVPARVEAARAAVAAAVPADLASAAPGAARASADASFAALTGERPAASIPALEAGRLPAADIPFAPLPPAQARPPSEGPRVHLLSKPLAQTVRLGRVARVLHYVLETAMQFVKAGLAWKTTGSPLAAAGLLAFELVKMPPMITAQSLADLGLRYWWKKLSVLREVSAAPGVTRVRVLTTGETAFSGILAVKQENTGLIFVDSDRALPLEMSPYGAPIPVADLGGRSVRMVLVHDGVSELTYWVPTLGELLSGRPIPPNIAAAWRARLDLDKKEKGRLARIFDFGKEKQLSVEAHLSDESGGEIALGTVAFGKGVKRLVGAGRWDRVKALFGGEPRGRAIPLSDTAVERGGVRGEGGPLGRAWRRLTGRLIVR